MSLFILLFFLLLLLLPPSSPSPPSTIFPFTSYPSSPFTSFPYSPSFSFLHFFPLSSYNPPSSFYSSVFSSAPSPLLCPEVMSDNVCTTVHQPVKVKIEYWFNPWRAVNWMLPSNIFFTFDSLGAVSGIGSNTPPHLSFMIIMR